MASPDSMIKSNDFISIFAAELTEPSMKTIIHANCKTTIVRNAVATSESVFLIPHFANIAVNPAIVCRFSPVKVAIATRAIINKINRQKEDHYAVCSICKMQHL